MRAIEPSIVHDGMTRPPAGHSAPGPEPDALASRPGLQLADAMYRVEGFDQGGGTGTVW
jgi:hypothetical protein